MFLGGDFVGGEVTGYLQIVERGAKLESGKNYGGGEGEGEGERRESVSSLHSLPTPPLAVFPARISLHRPTI